MKALIERVFAILPGAVLALTAAVLLLPGVLVTGDATPLETAAGPQDAKENDALRASGKQLEQCQACVDAIESARRAARTLRAELQKPAPAWPAVAGQHRRLGGELELMFAEQSKLAGSLRPEQASAVAAELRQLERLEKTLTVSLAEMERQLKAEAPSQRRLQTEVRQVERAILEWKMRQQTVAERLHALP